MSAIDVGVRHDDDPFVAKLRGVALRPGHAAHRLNEVGDFLIAAQLLVGSAGHVQDLAAQRQHGLSFTVAGLFCGSARGIPFDQENLRSIRAVQ